MHKVKILSNIFNMCKTSSFETEKYHRNLWNPKQIRDLLWLVRYNTVLWTQQFTLNWYIDINQFPKKVRKFLYNLTNSKICIKNMVTGLTLTDLEVHSKDKVTKFVAVWCSVKLD